MQIDPRADWQGCLTHLLKFQIPGKHTLAKRTIAKCLGELLDRIPGANSRNAGGELIRCGLGLRGPGEIMDCIHGYLLYVPNTSPEVSRLFADTEWARCRFSEVNLWQIALRHAPCDVVRADKRINRMYLCGQQYRCSVVIVKNALPLLENTQEAAPTPVRAVG